MIGFIEKEETSARKKKTVYVGVNNFQFSVEIVFGVASKFQTGEDANPPHNNLVPVSRLNELEQREVARGLFETLLLLQRWSDGI